MTAPGHALDRLEGGDLGRRILARFSEPIPLNGLIPAAVLVPLYREDGIWKVLLTRRTEDLEHHQGQVSFPGGRSEGGESPEETALRETREEIGIEGTAFPIIGRLDDVWTPSGYRITPILGLGSHCPEVLPNPDEVARVFSVPLAVFADPEAAEWRTMTVRGYTRDLAFYHYDGETIWGATEYILRGLIRRILDAPPPIE